ncbi:MAG: putative DNA-binding domain-containing protein [Elusimicrobia bacterium]|nr:putative DNA-binding domain-containing protein [Elusimicrobiota bacterium]
MPSLPELQRLFTASAFGAVDAAFVSVVEGGGALSAAEAVDVYRNGYPARLSEALGETFEACWRVLGDDDFLAACRDYARSTPSVSHNLSDYGRTFPEFLDGRHAEHAPFIGDLARLEWSFKELFHALPHAGLSPSALAAKARADSVFRFGAAAVFLSFSHRVHAIWKRDRSDGALLSPADWAGDESLVLYKNGPGPVFSRVLSRPEFSALTLLKSGRPLADALSAAEGLEEAGARGLFGFVAESGLVAEVA